MDLAKPETLAARCVLAESIEGHYAQAVSPLFQEEDEELKAAFDNATAEQKLALPRTRGEFHAGTH